MKNPIVSILLMMGFIVLIMVVALTITSKMQTNTIGYVQFSELIKNKQILGKVFIIDEKVIKGTILTANEKTEPAQPSKTFEYNVNLKVDPDVVKMLKENKIDFAYVESAQFNWMLFLFIGVIGFLIFRMAKNSSGGGMGAGMLGRFGGNVFNKYTPDMIDIRFDDVAGVDEAKLELSEIVDYLKNPDKFKKLGAKIPKGVLLTGKPGTGKTMLAKALAKEAGVPFYYGSGSDFIEVFVGVGASRMRSLFAEARKNNPCILFIDEIDAIGGKRDSFGSNSERDQTINALLTEMDGFSSVGSTVIVIAATNRSDILDPALKRPGRFDREVNVPPPSVDGRKKILEVHAKKIRKLPLDSDVDFDVLAKGTQGFTGAELGNLVNESAIMAGRKNKEVVSMKDFEEAKDKIILGLENKGFKINDKEKERTALHEAGHALMNIKFKEVLDTLHKVSIIPRGRALGVTMSLPDEEKTLNYSKKKCEALIKMLLAGRISEEIFYDGDLNTGASNDIEKVTQIARSMVYSWGMSSLGPINFESMGNDFKHKFSEETRMKADDEIMKIVNQNYEETKQILLEYKDKLNKIAQLLLEKETIDGLAVENIVLS
jgi:cell division protease FtsH